MAEKINIDDLMIESYSDKTVKKYSELEADEKSVFVCDSASRKFEPFTRQRRR